MSALLPVHREAVATWMRHGLPDDDSTRKFAVEVMAGLLFELGTREQIIEELLASRERQVTA